MIRSYIKNNFNSAILSDIQFDSDFTQSLLRTMENNLVFNNNQTGLVKFAKVNPQELSLLTFQLHKLGVATTTVSRNYNNISFNRELLDQAELSKYIRDRKIAKYSLRLDTTEYPTNLTKVNGQLRDIGLTRNGFAKVAKMPFSYDTQYLAKYRRPILQTMIKSITKSVEKGFITDKFFDTESNYMEMANLMLDHYIANPTASYNLERNLGENRGRSNFKGIKRIGNPIAYKDFRACMVVPGKLITLADTESIDAIYYFVAELCGNSGLTESEVIAEGKAHYMARHIPRVNLATEKGRKKLHEIIYLERIYSKLDKLHSRAGQRLGVLWDIPLEIDARMCVAQFYGALSNDENVLKSVSLIGTDINDPWFVPDVPRDTAKLLVAVLYGSSATSRALLKANGEEADPVLVKAMNKLRASGRFGVMEAFKNALIQDYNTHTPVVPIKLWNQEFNVYVNKFTTHGANVIATQAYDSSKRRFKISITHEPIKVPDYSRMKLYWATCCVHGLESQVFDMIADEEANSNWLITNHDAVLCMPWNTKAIRTNYASKLKAINRDRLQIIRDFRKSIGAVTPKSDLLFYKLNKLVKDAGDVEFQSIAMK